MTETSAYLEAIAQAEHWKQIALQAQKERDQWHQAYISICDVCERQAASHAHDRAMFVAKEERNRQALREGGQACLGDRCMCRTADCQSRAVCGLSGRVTQ